MDINLLTLGVGNSRVAVGVFVAGELREVTRIPVGEPEKMGEAIGRCWRLIDRADGRAVAAASVNPELDAMVGDIVEKMTGQSVQWVGREIDVPIEVRTREPGRTGIDRILNVAAAFDQIEGACIVVDAGTAVTVDCCNDSGEFVGGVILPGVEMMVDSLAKKTAGVGRISFSATTDVPGDSTETAVSLGICLAIRGMVKEFAESYATRIGHWPEIIATGGDAKGLFEGWELIHAIAPDLGLYGIALAYTEHHIEHEM